MDFLCLAIAGIFGYGELCAGSRLSPDCERYVKAFAKPETVPALIEWYHRLPKKIDPSKLRDQNIDGFGYSRYVLMLDFDPSKIGLRSGAHAEINLTNENEIKDVIVTDARRVMYVFRSSHDLDTYEFLTLPTARNKFVGVGCLKSD